MKLKRTILGPVLVAGVAVISGGWLLQHQAVAGGTGVDARILGEVLSHVSRDYVDPHTQDELYEMAVDGLLYELGDPHTTFMTAAEYNDLRVQTTGEYGGLGIQIAERNGWITVIAPLPETPADRAGLRSGDRIIEVDGKSTEGWSDDKAVKVLRGPKGAPVTISIARPGVDDPIEYTIVRDAIHVRSVQYSYMAEPGIGIMRLSVFASNSTAELKAAIDSLRNEGMKGLILDLRMNPGGLLDQGVSVSNLFLDPGDAIVETRGRDAQDHEEFSATRPPSVPDDMPVVVLVDDYTASAAEIVSGALQDHDRALVIGVPTFGKGSVQTLIPLSGGNFLKLTTGRWYTPSGRSIQREHEHEIDLPGLLQSSDIPGDGAVPAGQAVDTTTRKAYRTDSGRTVYGGGGIVPDLIVRPDTFTAAEKDFFEAASKSGSKFNDVLFRYAVEYAGAHPDLAQGFPVTDAMLAEFFDRLGTAGVAVTKEQFAGAKELVSQQVGYEIALAKFGTSIASQRSNQSSAVVRTAVELLENAPTREALFEEASTQKHALRR